MERRQSRLTSLLIQHDQSPDAGIFALTGGQTKKEAAFEKKGSPSRSQTHARTHAELCPATSTLKPVGLTEGAAETGQQSLKMQGCPKGKGRKPNALSANSVRLDA